MWLTFLVFPEDLPQLNASLSLISERLKDEQKMLLSTFQSDSHMHVLHFLHLEKKFFQCRHFSYEIINLGNIQFYRPKRGMLLHTMK